MSAPCSWRWLAWPQSSACCKRALHILRLNVCVLTMRVRDTDDVVAVATCAWSFYLGLARCNTSRKITRKSLSTQHAVQWMPLLSLRKQKPLQQRCSAMPPTVPVVACHKNETKAEFDACAPCTVTPRGGTQLAAPVAVPAAAMHPLPPPPRPLETWPIRVPWHLDMSMNI